MGWFRNRAVQSGAESLSASETRRRREAALDTVWPLAALALGVIAMLAWISFLGWAAYRIALTVLN